MMEPDLPVGGELFGYRVERLLGRGGMGVVYVAEDPRLRRRVALKVLTASLAEDDAFRDRFLVEAELAASLDHPCVVPIYEAGDGGGQLFIAMRYVEGGDLKALIAAGPLSAERALGICAQVADALDFAHEHGLVHGDVKPSNILLDGREHVYLADFGVTRRLEEPQLPEAGLLGTIDYVAPELIRGEQLDGRADQYSLGCLLHECLTGEPPFARTTDAAVLFAHLEEQPAAAPGLEAVIQKALAKTREDRYDTCAGLVNAAAGALGVGDSPRTRFSRAVICPFKGLAFFDRSDAEYFCGRDRLVSDLVARLSGSTLVGMLGPSGIGKSSLLRAAVLPALTAGVLPGSAAWQQVLLRPGAHPHEELARALGGEALEAVLARLAPGERIVVAIDQLEELFTACEREQDRATFLERMATAALDHERRVLFVVTLRADFYGHFAFYPQVADLLSRSHLLVGPMEPDELAQAIVQPAARAGLEIERPLVDALVSDVAGEPGGLPLLSTMLLELWRARDGRTLRYESYRASGGVRGVVARLAEGAFTRLDESERAAARSVMLRLAGGGDGPPARRRAPLSELKQIDRAERVLAVLTDARLLTVSEGSVELSHEALLHEWPRYSAWLDEDRVGRRLRAHVSTSAREWDTNGRDPGELYRGTRLTTSLDWAAQHHSDLNTLEGEFLDASQDAAERDVRRQRSQNRWLRSLVIGVGVLLIVAVAAGIAALVQKRNANHAARVAQSELLANQATTNGNLQLASLLALEAYRLSPTVEARSAILTVAASHELGAPLTGHSGPVNSVAFSANGRTLASASDDGTVRLWDVATHRQIGAPLNGHNGRASSVAFSPDGRTMAIGGSYGTVLWDVATHRQINSRLTAPGSGGVSSLAFSPNGRTLATATGGADRAFVRLWDVANHRQIWAIRASSNSGLDSVAFSPDGHTLASTDAGGTVKLWDVAHHRQLGAPLTAPASPITSGVTDTAFSPDGQTLATASQDGTVRLWDVISHRELGAPLIGNAASQVLTVAFSPNGRTLASTNSDGTIHLWDVASHHEIAAPLVGDAGTNVLSVAFSPNGRTLATGGDDDAVRLWSVASPRQLGAPLTGRRPIQSVTFSPDGRMLASVDDQLMNELRLWDVASHRQLGAPLAAILPGFPHTAQYGAPFDQVAFRPDSRALETSFEDSTVRAWDIPSHRQIGEFITYARVHTAHFTSSVQPDADTFSPDARMLATARRGIARLWNTASHREIGAPFNGGTSLTDTLAVSPDDRTLAIANSTVVVGSGTVRLWAIGTHRQLGAPIATGPAYRMTFSPDGRTLAILGDPGGTVSFWDVASHVRLGAPLNTVNMNRMAFSRDWRTLATVSDSGTVSLWDVASRLQLGAPLNDPTAQINSIAFSPDGRTLATGSSDGTIRLWSNYKINSYIRQLCAYIDLHQSERLWRRTEPSIPYQQPCSAADTPK